MLGFVIFLLPGATAKAPWISSIFKKNGVYITGDFNFEHQTSNRSLPSDRCPALEVQHVSKWSEGSLQDSSLAHLPFQKYHTSRCYLKIIHIINQNDRYQLKATNSTTFVPPHCTRSAFHSRHCESPATCVEYKLLSALQPSLTPDLS